MATITRKDFIKKSSLATMALLMQQIAGYSNKVPYTLQTNSNSNVTYYQKTDAPYETLRKGFNKRINNYPKIIALCATTNGVVEAMQYATSKGLQVTVKSGGHCMEGFSSSNGGLVINLSLLNTIQWVDANTIKVGPACTLKQIYETVIPKGKYLPGGSCQTVGIGGLTLGGGYGLLSRAYGLTCDSLLQATMVTGNGTIVNTTSNAQLLWACKGGGNGNFAAITELQYKLQQAPSTMVSYKFRNQGTTLENAITICSKWFELSKTLPNTCFSAFIYNGKTTYILLTNVGKNNSVVQQFIETFKALSTKFTAGNPISFGTALKAYYAEANPITFKNASAGLYKSYSDIEGIVKEVFTKVKSTPGILYQINTLGGAIQNPQFEKASSFAHRDCIYFSEQQAYWESATANDKYLKAFEQIQAVFAKAGVTAQYRNYPDINFNNWAQLYYGKNLAQLQKIKNTYDPNNIFGGIQTLKASVIAL